MKPFFFNRIDSKNLYKIFYMCDKEADEHDMTLKEVHIIMNYDKAKELSCDEEYAADFDHVWYSEYTEEYILKLTCIILEGTIFYFILKSTIPTNEIYVNSIYEPDAFLL